MTLGGVQKTSSAGAPGAVRVAPPHGSGGDLGVRSVRRRRDLPSSRAVVGALLVTAAAVLTFVLAGGDEGPTQRYVVAARALQPGEVLEGRDLTTVVVDLPAEVAASAYDDPAVLGQAVVRGPVAAGSLLTSSAVQLRPAALAATDRPTTEGSAAGEVAEGRFREVSFAVPRARALLGELAPGDLVDVLSADGERTEVLVQQALVLDTSSAADGALVLDDDVVITIALADGRDALAVAHGAAVGELSVLRSTRAEDRLAARYPSPASDAAPASSPAPGSPSTASTAVTAKAAA